MSSGFYCQVKLLATESGLSTSKKALRLKPTLSSTQTIAMKSYLILGILLCWMVEARAQGPIRLFYASAESTLNSPQKEELQQLVKLWRSSNIEEITITGHADPVGSTVYNQSLSELRANTVRSFLASQGIPPSQLTTYYEGERKASFIDKSAWRRVDISWTTPEIYKPIEELYSKLSNTQRHYINPEKDTFLRCEEGSIIHIKAGTFSAKGKKALVLFEVKEVYNKSDMILENLSTMSDGNILETRGMIYTNAMSQGDTLKPSKDISIMMPTEDYTAAAGVFDGNRDPHSDAMNWAVNNNSVLRNFSVSDFSDCEEYANTLAALEAEGVATDAPGYLTLTCLLDSALAQCGGCVEDLCGTRRELKCRLFFCRMKRIPRGIAREFGSLFSKKVRIRRRERRQDRKADRTLDTRLEKLREKDKPLTVKEVTEVEDLLRRKKARDGSAELTDEEKKMIRLSRLIRKSDSLIATETYDVKTTDNCAELKDLFATYGVMDVQALTLAINRPLLDEFEVETMEELMEALSKANFNNLEEAYEQKNISYEDFKFYIFNASTLGWKNIDIFANIPMNQRVAVQVNLSPSPEVDCKLVFKEREFVIPGKIGDGYFYFEGMPKGEEAWVVAIKYENETPYLALIPIKVANKSFTPTFREKSLEELKADLKVLDFNKSP